MIIFCKKSFYESLRITLYEIFYKLIYIKI
jgi:hypothetical protein